MQAKYISYKDTASFSKLALDYIYDQPQLKDFYNYRPELQGLKSAVENRAETGDRNILVSVLQQQYASLTPNKSVLKNIELLASTNTFTVTTGHQLNLFTGPLYFIYKIVTAINLARELKIAQPDKNFVPLYWMATEDHDFEEINHVNVDEKNISWLQSTDGATGRLSTKTVAAAVTAYTGYLGISENGKHLADIVQQAYLEHDNLADATRFLVNELFQKYGLVIINADDKQLKTEFLDIMLADITKQNSARTIENASKKLEDFCSELHRRRPDRLSRRQALTGPKRPAPGLAKHQAGRRRRHYCAFGHRRAPAGFRRVSVWQRRAGPVFGEHRNRRRRPARQATAGPSQAGPEQPRAAPGPG